jgi:TPR repeat protein/CubicO group peptidase (beta-lactamase class C family)
MGQCAIFYEEGKGTEKNPAEAFRWWNRKAEKGDFWALGNVARCYANGIGTPKNPEEAAKWYGKAQAKLEEETKKNEAWVWENLGKYYLNGLGVEKDYAKALECYHKAADLKSGWAMEQIGWCYEKGHGVAKDEKEALRWYQQAANLGQVWSAEHLGEIYYYGRGVPQDLTKAIEAFRGTAERGSAYGQSWVGYFYETGQGIDVDLSEAVRWTKMAAEQGRGSDVARLAGYYWFGKGVKQDRKEALIWYKKAASLGEKDAVRQLPILQAQWEKESRANEIRKTNLSSESDVMYPARWKLCGPWKIKEKEQEKWFHDVQSNDLPGNLTKGAKAKFCGEEKEVIEVLAKSTGNMLAESFGNHANSFALLEAEMDADKGGKRILSVGSDDAVKIWMNGQLVAEEWVGRSLAPNEELYSVELKPGVNRLQALLVNHKGDWGFFISCPNRQQAGDLLVKSVVGSDYSRSRLLLEGDVDRSRKTNFRLPALETAQLMRRTHIEELIRSYGVRENLLAWSHYPRLVQIFGPWFMPKNKTKPGHGFLYGRNGKIMFEHYSGLANVENKVPIGPHTKFAIGSITKQFVAAAMLKMQDEGKLKLNNCLSDYLNGFSHGNEITLRQLLTHTSGIREYTSGERFNSRCGSPPSPGEILQMIEQNSFGDKAGRRFSYSNSNYYLAGLILEKVSGERLDRLLDRLFFKPLGMTNTQLAIGEEVIENYATPYVLKDGKTETANACNMDWFAGAGGIVSTPRDLFLWNEALWNGKVLQAESLQAAFRPEITEYSKSDSSGEGYGCGWGTRDVMGRRWIGHGGYIPPYRASLWRVPDFHVTAVALTNAGEGFAGMDPEAMAVGSVCFFENSEMGGTVRDQPAAELSDDEIAERTGFYDDGINVLEIKKEGRRWLWQGDWVREELRAVGRNYFVGKKTGKLVEILFDGQGKVLGFKMLEAYFPIHFIKLPPRKECEEFNARHLGDYTGKYDLGTYGVCEITQESEGLVGKLKELKKATFRSLNRDEFMVEGMAARFSAERDSLGKVTGGVFRWNGIAIEAPKVQ